jgi:protein SCO1/2
MTRTALSIVVLAALAVAGCGNGSHGGSSSKSAAANIQSGGGGVLPPSIRGKAAPQMHLVDARSGAAFDTSSLTGRPYAVTFLYTRCRTTCPLIADEVRVAIDKLGAVSKKVAVVALSVDPVGDTRARVKRFLDEHHEPQQFHYLIGPRSKLEPLWKAWFAAAQPAGANSSVHTAAMWFVDRRGHIVDLVPAGAPIAPATITSKFHSLMS